MTCRTTARALDAFVDGELEASDSLHIDGHLEGCPTCAERAAFQRIMKREIQREARSERAPDSLRARIMRDAAKVRVREQERARRPSWRSAIPWAAAASIALMVGGGMRTFGTTPRTNVDSGHDPVSAAAAHSFILDEFGAYHASPLPPEEMDPVRISSVFSPIVGVPVHPTVFGADFDQKPTRFSGARLMRVHDQAAATLFYDVGGRRVTIFVFDPQRIRLRGTQMSPRYVNARGEDRVIFMGRAKGYPLAAFERDGVGYAVSSDMPDHDVLSIAASL
jgi:mycothiol system anti-sigma-R factor